MTPTPFARAVKRGLRETLVAATRGCAREGDFRAAICRFEDDLFAAFPGGHRLLGYDEAVAMIGDIFTTLRRAPPSLALVAGFDDPRIGGFADIRNHRIAIERGFLYRFLVLHEAAHLIVPEDRRHGPAFSYILQLLYRSFIGVPEEAVRRFLGRHGLPVYTGTVAADAA
jgi:hypothetical protein